MLCLGHCLLFCLRVNFGINMWLSGHIPAGGGSGGMQFDLLLYCVGSCSITVQWGTRSDAGLTVSVVSSTCPSDREWKSVMLDMSNSWSLQLDCLVLQLLLVLPLLLLLVLSQWGHIYFWPETAFKQVTLCIFEIIFPSSLIQKHLKKIQNKVQVPNFFSKVNLKSNAAQWLSSCW